MASRTTARTIAAGLATLVAAGASPARGQDAPRDGPPIPAVEVFDPATGERTHRLRTPLPARALRDVERALGRAGYRPGPVDGRGDRRTERALRRFQADEGLDRCGCVNWATVRRLGLPTAVTQTLVRSGGDRPERGADVDVVYPTGATPPDEDGPDVRERRPRAADTVRRPERAEPRERSRFRPAVPVFVPRSSGRPRTVPSGARAAPRRPAAGTGRILPLFPFVRPVIRP